MSISRWELPDPIAAKAELTKAVLPLAADVITELSAEIHALNKAKGFWDAPHSATLAKEVMDYTVDPKTYTLAREVYENSRRNKGELLMLIVSEAGEALEAIRGNKISTKLPDNCPEEIEEIADIIIRCLDYAAGFGYDIGEVIRQKLLYNETRPHKHGKNF